MRKNGKARLLSAGVALVLLMGMLPVTVLGAEGEDAPSVDVPESGYTEGNESGGTDDEAEAPKVEAPKSEDTKVEEPDVEEPDVEEPRGEDVEDNKSGDETSDSDNSVRHEPDINMPSSIPTDNGTEIVKPGSIEPGRPNTPPSVEETTDNKDENLSVGENEGDSEGPGDAETGDSEEIDSEDTEVEDGEDLEGEDGEDAGEGEPEEGEETEVGAEEVPEPPITLTPNKSGKITVDGSNADWVGAGINGVSLGEGANSNGVDVNCMRVAMDTDGNVYICLEGSANDWSSVEHMYITVRQDNEESWEALLNYNYSYVCDSNGSSYAPFVLEFSIPASYFTDSNFIIGFNNVTFPAGVIPVLDGVDMTPKPERPVYNGITIDGKFDDWAAVTKYDAHDGNQLMKQIDEMAMVFEGDYVYIYIKEASGGSAASAGSHSNGKYAIVTDLGRQMLFELNYDGTVSGPAGATARHVGSQWEIMIPASNLPLYANTISVGLYMGTPAVSDVANLDGSNGNLKPFNGIVIDGHYHDWDSYPHELIQHDTPGTDRVVPDGEAALYSENGKLYGHVVTYHPDHLGEQGGEFLAAITVAFNGDRNNLEGHAFYPTMRDGDTIYLDEFNRLPNGIYALDILSTPQVGNNSLVYGTMYITVSDTIDEMEFELDLAMVGEYLNLSPSDMKLIEAQFGRIGNEWISTAGTSSGPLLGVAICVAMCGAVLWVRKRKDAEAAG